MIYLKKQIMEQSRHQFVYSYSDNNRKLFLQKLERLYPIKMDCNSPMCIYLKEYGLPKISMTNNEIDKSKIDILSREYLSSSIAHSILQKSRYNVEIDLLNKKRTEFYEQIDENFVFLFLKY